MFLSVLFVRLFFLLFFSSSFLLTFLVQVYELIVAVALSGSSC